MAAKGISNIIPRGPGGRSSVSGITATVFGATGFLGRYVVSKLGKVGSQIIIPFRGEELDFRHLRVNGDVGQIHFYNYNLRDYDSITKNVKYSNVVVNLAGQLNHSRHYTMHEVNAVRAGELARAAREAGVERFIHVSALNASSSSPSEFYRSKAAGEEAVLREFPNATILRPSAMFGLEDKFLHRFGKWTRFFGFSFLVDGGEALRAPVYVVDVANAVMGAIADPSSAGKIYELTGDTTYTTRDLSAYVAQMIRKEHRVVGIPFPLARVGARLHEKFMGPLDPFITEDEIVRATISDARDGSLPGLQDLGVVPTKVDAIATSILRRYRKSIYHDELFELDQKSQ